MNLKEIIYKVKSLENEESFDLLKGFLWRMCLDCTWEQFEDDTESLANWFNNYLEIEKPKEEEVELVTFSSLKNLNWEKVSKVIGVDYYKKQMVEDSEIFTITVSQFNELFKN